MRDIVLDLLTTPLSGTICTNFGDIARVESYLWTLLTSSQYPSDILLPFKKEEIVECLKSFRSILTATGWKVSNPNTRPDTNNSNPSRTAKSQLDISNHLNHSTDHMVSKVKETEEFLHILHLLSIVSRSLILAWNSYEKVQIQSNTSPVYSPSGSNYSEATLESLLNCLTPGSASDLANMILEGVKLCYHHVWLKRYESLHIRHGFHDLHINLHSRSSDEDHQIHSPGSQSILRNRYLRAGKLLRMIDRKRYMSVQHIELPVRCIFQQICKHIPTYSVDVLHHIVDPSTQAINSHTPTLPTPPPQSSSSWSLWRR